jgi:putative membrane protein
MYATLAYWGWRHGGGWFWLWPLFPLFWLFVLFFCFRFFWGGGWWRGGWDRPYAHYPDARAILAERYARGDISADEYHERLANLVEPDDRTDR